MSKDQQQNPDQNLVLGIPVKLMPHWETEYSIYEKVKCPFCGEDMWLGLRQRNFVAEGKGVAVCALCAVGKFGVTMKDFDGIRRLTDQDS